MIDNKNNGESYCAEFREQITRGMEVLKKRGYRPVMASETEVVFSNIENPEHITSIRTTLISKISDEMSKADFVEIGQEKVKDWFAQNKIPYEESKHGNTQKRFVELLSREIPATISELMMFYMQEINQKTRDIIDYQYGHYEDAVDVYELRIKPSDPIEWCKNFRTLKNELIEMPKKLVPELKWHYEQMTNHTHISMHKGGQAIENNLADNKHPEHLTIYKKFIELQTKALFDGHFFSRNPDDSRREDSIERRQAAILFPTRATNIRDTGYSTEIRTRVSESHQTPELTALLFCVAPILAATKQSPEVDAAYEKGEIIKAKNVKKLQLPKPMHHEGGEYFEALSDFRQYMHSFVKLDGREKEDFIGFPLLEGHGYGAAITPQAYQLAQSLGMISRDEYNDYSRQNNAIQEKKAAKLDVSAKEEEFRGLMAGFNQKALDVLQVIEEEDSRIFNIHVNGEKPVTLNDSNDQKYKKSWEIVNKSMPILRKYIKELADGAQWVDRLAVFNSHEYEAVQSAYEENVRIPRFPKTPSEKKGTKGWR